MFMRSQIIKLIPSISDLSTLSVKHVIMMKFSQYMCINVQGQNQDFFKTDLGHNKHSHVLYIYGTLKETKIYGLGQFEVGLRSMLGHISRKLD